MIGVGCLFIWLAVRKGFEPLLLVPIGFGILIGNIPYDTSSLSLSVYDGPVSDHDIVYYMIEEGEVGDGVVVLEEIEELEASRRTEGDYLVHEGEAVMVNTHSLFAAPAWVAVSDPEMEDAPAGLIVEMGQGRRLFVSELSQTPDGKYPEVWSPERQDVFNASILWWLFAGVGLAGFYPPLIFLGIGALTDFGPMLANPKTLLLGAAAQFGIFAALLGAVAIGFTNQEAAAIGIIGGADGPTAIFTCSQLAPHLLGAVALAAYSYMAMVPIIQPPIMKLLTTKEERLIRMEQMKPVSKRVKIVFPIVGFLLTAFIAPGGLPLLGMLFFGNLLRESMVTDRLAKTAQSTFIDIVTILLGVTVGAKTSAANFLTLDTISVFALGICAFAIATATGVLFAKLMNVVFKEKINPLIGAAGVSAVPMAARVVHKVGQDEDPQNFLLMHAMGPNVAGVIGSAVAAGVLLSQLG
ncbi:sodium ion-translocating decarboxylase subunit beta [Mucisphaera sp.]|uniref:sodium ion-translocating decarboxylase subunit beta n=1 Tax=Mucisphaera sp. TaxID=2913024 RepID=UPI003D100DB3